jgi:hypothetical protein
VRLLGHEVDHSPLSGTKVKNKWSYTSTPFIWPHGLDRENFAFFTFLCTSRLLVGKTDEKFNIFSRLLPNTMSS